MSAVDVLRRPLPRSWSTTVAAVLLALCVVLWGNAGSLHVFFSYWTGRGAAMADMPWHVLSPDLDESALLAAVPVGQRCIAQDKASNGLGDRVCYAPLQSMGGIPAVTVAFFFNGGRLSHAVVQVPWWTHHRTARAVLERLGMPEAAQDRGDRGNRLMQWRVRRGLVELNRDPGWNPLQVGAIFWTALPPPR